MLLHKKFPFPSCPASYHLSKHSNQVKTTPINFTKQSQWSPSSREPTTSPRRPSKQPQAPPKVPITTPDQLLLTLMKKKRRTSKLQRTRMPRLVTGSFGLEFPNSPPTSLTIPQCLRRQGRGRRQGPGVQARH